MTRSILCGLLALISVGALGVVPIACQSGGVGDPCTPEDEYDTQFPGFKVAEENIESRSFQCATRICLVNHFQGRVSCPEGQTSANIEFCNPSGAPCSDTTAKCVEAETLAPECTCDGTGSDACATASACSGLAGSVCDATLKICKCTGDQTINGTDYYCELSQKGCTGPQCALVLKSYLCHTPLNCQAVGAMDNAGKPCCIPGTDTPVGVEVCGQCETSATSHRNAADAVYCSCRCCEKCCNDPSVSAADKAAGNCEMDLTLCGSACDPNFNYCSCPNGFTCSEIRKNVGLGDAELTGSYCIKTGTAYGGNSAECGVVDGNANPLNCAGVTCTPPCAPGESCVGGVCVKG